MSKPISVSRFMDYANPCTDGYEYLRGFETMRAAWLSDTAEPEHMLWALCHNPRVRAKQLLKLMKALHAEGLINYRKPDLEWLGAISEQPGPDRYFDYPCIDRVPDPKDSECGMLRTDAQKARQLEIIRKVFPRAFLMTDAAWVKAWELAFQ